jgi:hypothetical protein
MTLSTYLGDAVLNWLRGTSAPSAPTPDLYLSLHSSDPGPSGTLGDVTAILIPAGRVSIAQTIFSAPSSDSLTNARQITNSSQITLTSSAGGDAGVTHAALWDSQSGGNFLIYGAISPPLDFVAGDVIFFSTGRLVIRT